MYVCIVWHGAGERGPGSVAVRGECITYIHTYIQKPDYRRAGLPGWTTQAFTRDLAKACIARVRG